MSPNSIAISKRWLVYCTLSYFRSYILSVLRNRLVQKFPNHLYLFLFYIISILIFPQREQFFSTKTRLDLSLTCLNWKIYLPCSEFKPSIRTLLGKNIHFNCPLKLWNNFISFREPIYFSKQKMFFIKIFEITDNNLKIQRFSRNFEVDLIYLWKYSKCLKFLGCVASTASVDHTHW